MDFEEGLARLSDAVGHGDLVGSVEVNQVYASPIDLGYWFTGPLAGHTNHPRHGGQQHFLEDAFYDNAGEYADKLASQALEQGGLVDAMVDNVEHASGQVNATAPIEFGDLRRSGHPFVDDDGVRVYDRAPAVERLSRAQLEAKSKLVARAAAQRRGYWIDWDSDTSG